MFEKIKSVASNARNAINRKLVSVQSYVMAEAPNVLTSKAGTVSSVAAWLYLHL